MPPLGVSLMPLENRRESIIRCAVGADRLGWDAFFLTETWAHDATVLLAEAAVRTERIRLGSGIVGVWNRTAATLAMAATSLHAASGGRFILGLGASTRLLTEGLHDLPFATPEGQMRKVLGQVRALLAGERIPLASATGARPLRLNLPAAPGVPIYLAALAERSVRLAGELADGWLPFLFPRNRLREGRGWLAQGAAAAGRAERHPRVCPFVPAVVAETTAQARDGAAWFLAFYMTSMGPFYPGVLRRLGFAREVDAVVRTNPGRGAPAVLPPEAEPLADQLLIWGTPAECRRGLARWYEAGAEEPILLLRPGLSDADLDFALEALGPGAA